MENETFSPDMTADGPEGLRKVLNDLYASSQSIPNASELHTILYRLGNQKSIIKVDVHQSPWQFWYYDLLGRPVTQAVKDTINDFLLDKYGEAEGRAR